MRRVLAVLAISTAAFTGGVLPTSASGATTDFTNATALAPNDLDNATPTNIVVSNLPGVVTDVNIVLNNVTHTNPDDLEVLLGGPFSHTTVLMNDVGGTANIANLTLPVNDEGVGPFPDNAQIVNQPYEPTDAFMQPGLEPFISPAPAPPYSLTLAGFDGIEPNGTWTMWVDDDVFNANTGSIAGGWTLQLTTTDPPPATPATPATPDTPITPVTPPTATTTKKKCKKKKKRKPAAAAAKKCKKKRKSL